MGFSRKCTCGKYNGDVHFHESEPVVHPTKHRVVDETEIVIIPEIHPTHTTVRKKRVYRHVHSYPESISIEESSDVENVVDRRPRRDNGERRGRGWSWI
ncbi:inner spore coat protein D [Bacillus sp. JCM 19046]|uniref:Spore coat protein D n=1 Tax=Shouchella xiaoxiensis TaxID=766895 RepID=A0ABS2SY57_9BACI|nr:CotD family spore coat protein [Shouchella xiaoxiensis]MBM7839966.1 spore coat protein D [Shouchella xiaoxiensis]GAF12674.1 inner spore coat protein D [Bacillus sp. JCM 19045]GAF17761.1 inner spore coat protein D [Bacillus sp. JCM 19046]